ncbi:RNase H family protein [Salinibacterium sp. ZJ450]|uniref:RNase H family protein n=1 Tax=Salinibacterium sp. ZJ450 TaxID=2708338 RepID=UPI001422E3C2|nr:RNase H family protein [Salinibacterium sp. ZJ450]
MTIVAAADGSALGNPGPAGWAWYVDDGCWGAGGWKHATNNQGELKAVLELFKATAHLDDDLLVLCDSQYVINAVTKWMRGWKAKGWRKGDGKPVLNLELLKELDEAIAGRQYRFEWVKGHVGHVLNEAADARARAVAEAYQRGLTIPSGPGWNTSTDVGVTVTPRAVTTAAPSASAAISEIVMEPETLADVEALVPAAVEADEPALFDFDGDVEPDEWHTISLSLTTEEHTRLQQRARLDGVTVEELLRSLI